MREGGYWGWEGGIGDEEQAVEAEETGTDPAAALAVVKGLDLAHGAVEAHPLAGGDATGLSLGTIPVLADVRHIIYNTRRVKG